MASLSVVPLASAESLLSKDNALLQAFPKPISVETKWAVISPDQAERISRAMGSKNVSSVFRYYEATSNEVIVGYAIIDNTPGKHGPIRFMVVINPDMTVKSVTILAFYEKRGRPIRGRGFLSQFAGKKMTDRFRLNRDIDGITGATISSRAVARGVKNVVSYVTVLLRSKAKIKKSDA